MGTHTSGAKELMVGLEGPRESFVPIHFALSMELCRLVEQLLAGVFRVSINCGHVGPGLCLVHPLQMAEGLEPGANEGTAFVGDEFTEGTEYYKVKKLVFVPRTSCCTTIRVSHFPHENVVFIVGFSNGKGWLTIGVCLVVPKSDCLTQVWVKEAPGGPV